MIGISTSSIVKEFIPTYQQLLSILFDKFLNTVDFYTTKSFIALKPHRSKPKFSPVVITLNYFSSSVKIYDNWKPLAE